MKTLWSRSKKIEDESFQELEYYLRTILKPVEPRVNFVSDLKARLVHTPDTGSKLPARFHYALLAVAGVISSILIVITGVRAALTLLGAMGLMRHIKGQAQSN